MRPKLTMENLFRQPHYKSVLNLLIEFQDKEFQDKTGLRPLQFRYALEKGYKDSKDVRVKVNIDRLKKFFGSRLDILTNNGQIVPDCIKSKYGLSKFLRNLKNPPISAIGSSGSHSDIRYRTKKDFYTEGIRIQNKSAFDLFPQDKIMIFPSKSRPVKHLVYGLSEKIYDNFDIDDKEVIQNCLKEMEKNINKIENTKIKVMSEELKKKTGIFLDKTQSETVKKALEEQCSELWISIMKVLLCNTGENKDIRNTWDVRFSKQAFFYILGWIFKVPEEKAFPKRIKYHPVINPPQGIELYNFIADLPSESINLSQNEVEKYLKAWSKNFFYKDYKFSVDDVKEIIEWCWSIRELFFDFLPISIAFSRYGEYTENILVKTVLDKSPFYFSNDF